MSYSQLMKMGFTHELMMLAAMITSFIVALTVIPKIISIALERNLVDNPNHRTSHKAPVPTLGGAGIFLALVVSVLFWVDFAKGSQITFFIVAVTVLFIMGIIDDLKEISASKKFLIQIILAFMIVHSGAKITSLYGLFGVGALPAYMQYLLSILVIAGMTNAVNLLDGIDGLAGGVGAINSIIFCFLFLGIGEIGYAVIAISLAGGLLGFLRYNFSPAKIFMGDTGSLLIGYSLALFGIKFLQLNLSTESSPMILVFGILVLPVFDTLRVFAIRILDKRSPFSPDKNHIHHLLLKTGYNHKYASIFMYLANLMIIGEAFILKYFNVNILASVIALFGTAIFLSELITIIRVFKMNKHIHKLFRKKAEFKKENHLLNKLG